MQANASFTLAAQRKPNRAVIFLTARRDPIWRPRKSN